MSQAIRIFQGDFGRVALLDMDKALVIHAHSECHVLLKAYGADTYFNVRNHSHYLSDRSAVLVNAWEPHWYEHQPAAPDTIILALYIDPRWLAGSERSLGLSAWPGFFPQPCVELSPLIRRRADTLIMNMLSMDAINQSTVEGLIFDLMIGVIEQFSEWQHLSRLFVPGMRKGSDARIRRAISALRRNLDDPVDFETLAHQSGLSRAHFFKLFRDCTHLTPGMFTKMLRMERACERLADTNDGTLGRLSRELGFSEQGHFTRFFRQHQGVAPGDYRRIVDNYGHYAVSRLPD